MGSLCWKAISMDKLTLMMIIGVYTLISFGQDNLLSATTSHDKVESLVDHLDMKLSQMMKQLQEENKQQHEDINNMQITIEQHQEEIINLQKENQENEGKMKKLQRENIQQEEKIIHLEADSMKCSQETLSKIEEQTNHVSTLTELVDSLNNKSFDHEKSINVLRSPPAVYFCGYQSLTYVTNSVITFDENSYARNNQHTGGLDPKSGVFTSPYQGTYSVSWTLTAHNDAGDHYVGINLQKNGDRLRDYSRHVSYYSGPSGLVDDQGGRTLIIDLLKGETLSMFCEDCSAGVYYVNFCVSLVY